jgi:sugar phosphate isomerase/epimerase
LPFAFGLQNGARFMSLFRVGLNPYGLAYTVGLQGAGTARANPRPIGIRGYLDLARELDARCFEVHGPWLMAMADDDLGRLRQELAEIALTPIVSVGLTHERGETLETAIGGARAIGARLIRLGLTPVLEGARAAWGARWEDMRSHALSTLVNEAPRVGDAGMAVAIEDHQDFGSDELMEMAERAGDNVGVVMDTGNPFSVGEDPVAFARRVASRLRHVHLKDYRAQFTDEGFRLVRCAIGDGAVPFGEIAAVLADHPSVTASIEPGALEARHIRLFTPGWWRGYPSRDAVEIATALGRLRRHCLTDDEPYQTPWERGAAGDEIVAFELAQVRRSAANVRQWEMGGAAGPEAGRRHPAART